MSGKEKSFFLLKGIEMKNDPFIGVLLELRESIPLENIVRLLSNPDEVLIWKAILSAPEKISTDRNFVHDVSKTVEKAFISSLAGKG